ncbi:L-2-hydroxyglutarate oxidase [Shewanella surugensis]|uniref:L-2-hydroxyglutarate oxidase n=1 Tax=Shewanella surugensis TaxID=212020 RepID=A0ABT0LBU4_9GAMM|nr:L-2-hydroxyglutarate oxidase [Shewanella surugensis]MCL1124827.1 L-2-hydroxyglutarate oxidase [Shewanella surugensis]
MALASHLVEQSQREQNKHDIVVVGAGIVGIATACELQRRQPQANILVLEKESAVALHQTGRNSGVIHAGVYYAPGSLKAQFCTQGNRETKAFCLKHDIPFEECGKLIVATQMVELTQLDALKERCQANGIEAIRLNAAELKEKEPNIIGFAALWVADSAIVNYQQIVQVMAKEFVLQGGEIRFEQTILSIKEHECVQVQCQNSLINADQLICCAGLMADKLVSLCGIEADFRILPFKGEYFLLNAKHNSVVNHLIYPVPDPKLPFLGVHLTKMIDGTVTVGPNAVLSMKREGYEKWDWDLKECLQMFCYVGFWRVMAKYWRSVLTEVKNSLSTRGYLKRVNQYCPSIERADLQSYPCGIRAQAVSMQGELLSDFHFQSSKRTFHVCNAPSPAATSALPIARYIVDHIEK